MQRDFSYPDGKLAARERIVYEGDTLVSYELDETQIGAKGSARIERTATMLITAFNFEYATEAQTKARSEAWQENTLIADMVAPFLVAQWDAPLHGDIGWESGFVVFSCYRAI